MKQIGRNSLCLCGCGRKYKICREEKLREAEEIAENARMRRHSDNPYKLGSWRRQHVSMTTAAIIAGASGAFR